jgi:hypothetical protein
MSYGIRPSHGCFWNNSKHMIISNEPRRLLDFGPIQGGVSPPVTCSENHQYLTAMAVYHQRIVDAFSVTHLISQEPSIAWLQGRGGRVLRLKIGDLEVEVTAQSEFDVLLAKALAMKAGQPIAELDHE